MIPTGPGQSVGRAARRSRRESSGESRRPGDGPRAHERSPTRTGRAPAGGRRARGISLEKYLQATFQMVAFAMVLDVERQVMELRRHPWCGELHWRLTWRLYELAVDEQLLLAARAKLTGERYRRVPIEPPQRLVAPSERITEAGRAFSDVLRLLTG